MVGRWVCSKQLAAGSCPRPASSGSSKAPTFPGVNSGRVSERTPGTHSHAVCSLTTTSRFPQGGAGLCAGARVAVETSTATRARSSSCMHASRSAKEAPSVHSRQPDSVCGCFRFQILFTSWTAQAGRGRGMRSSCTRAAVAPEHPLGRQPQPLI